MIEDLKELEQYICTNEGKKKYKKLIKKIKRIEKYTDKLDTYFVYTLDGFSPSEAKEMLGL